MRRNQVHWNHNLTWPFACDRDFPFDDLRFFPPSSCMFLSWTPSWMRLSASLCSLMPIATFLDAEPDLFVLRVPEAFLDLDPDFLREALLLLADLFEGEADALRGLFLRAVFFAPFLFPPTNPLPDRSMFSTLAARVFIAARAPSYRWFIFFLFVLQ